jgi:hypothetical protein
MVQPHAQEDVMVERTPTDPPNTASNQDADLDPGAFVGNRPERQAETIPGGVRPDDQRVAANSSQATGEPEEPEPRGHREGDRVSPRQAGQGR